MRRLLIGLLWATMLFVLPASHAQTPANEHNCPATTAIPPYVGSGTKAFSPNQNLCLPLSAFFITFSPSQRDSGASLRSSFV